MIGVTVNKVVSRPTTYFLTELLFNDSNIPLPVRSLDFSYRDDALIRNIQDQGDVSRKRFGQIQALLDSARKKSKPNQPSYTRSGVL